MAATTGDVIRTAYEAVREHVGRSYQRDLGVIREMDLLRFAVSIDGGLSLDANESSAPPLTDVSVSAPPLYLTAVVGWESGPPEAALLADGTPSEALANLPVAGLRLMGGGQALEFYRLVVPGMRVVQESRVLDVKLKEGRAGSLLLIEVERLFLHEDQPLVRCRETFIAR